MSAASDGASNQERPTPEAGLFIRLSRAFLVSFCLGGAIAYLIVGVKYNLLVAGPGFMNLAGNGAGSDFIAFYAAAKQAAAGGAAGVYDVAKLHALEVSLLGADAGVYPWSYPPPYLLVVAPLALLPFVPALWTWLIATTGALILAVRQAAPHLLTPVLVVIFPGVMQNLFAGQNGALSAALIAGGLVSLASRPALAGFFFGMMIYKPHIALLLPLCLIAGKHFRALLWMVVTAAALVLASLAAFGLEPWTLFIEQMPKSLEYNAIPLLPWQRVPTVFIAVMKATDNLSWALAAQGISTVAAVAACAWVWMRNQGLPARALALAAAIPLATPHALDYDMAILVIPFAFLAWQAWRSGPRPGALFILVLLWIAPLLMWFASHTIGQQVGPAVFIVLLVYAFIYPSGSGLSHRLTPPSVAAEP